MIEYVKIKFDIKKKKILYDIKRTEKLKSAKPF